MGSAASHGAPRLSGGDRIVRLSGMVSWLRTRRKAPPLATAHFRGAKERSVWYLAAAIVVAGLWAIADQLGWPVGVKAGLAALAVTAGLVVPELQQRAARSDKSAQLVGRLVASTPLHGLPLAREVRLADLRVHQSSSAVPYVRRDVEKQIDELLSSATPTLLVGHSMAGKTRLAAERVRSVLPDAPVLIPASTSTLRDLIDGGLVVSGVVIWLDDIDRFLKGEGSLDVPLIKQLINGGASLIGTIRVHEFQDFMPSDLARPEPWDVIDCFIRVRMDRLLTKGERERAEALITDVGVLEAMNRYGLAEYLGAGPQALERYRNGETENAVGHALVHAAIDWRRAGLTRRVPRDDLVASIPEYLDDRPSVAVNSESIDSGFDWASERINETVTLLARTERGGDVGAPPTQLYEAFDYLVDAVADAAETIPGGLWLQVVRSASRAESGDISRAADRLVDPRPGVTAEIARWLAAKTDGKMLAIVGGPWSGKSFLLAQLALIANNDWSSSGNSTRLALPPFDLVTSARGKTVEQLQQEVADAVGMEHDGGYATLRLAIENRPRPVYLSIDGLDESLEPDGILRFLGSLAAIESLDIHVLIAARRMGFDARDQVIIDLDNYIIDQNNLRDLIIDRLLAGPYGATFAGDKNETFEVAGHIAMLSQGSVLYATIMAQSWAPGQRSIPADPGGSLAHIIERTIGMLRKDYPLAEPILQLFTGESHAIPESRIVEIIEATFTADPQYIRDTLEALLRSHLIRRHTDDGSNEYFITHAAIREYLRNGKPQEPDAFD
jgi:hypothetical protein